MSLIETIKEAIESIRLHKLRSILTMLGIIIGVGTIIGLLSISLSTKQKILQEIEEMGSDIIWINPIPQSQQVNDKNRTFPVKRLVERDIRAIKSQCSSIVTITKELREYQPVIFRNRHFMWDIFGIEPAYLKVRKFRVIQGRFISSIDLTSSQRICVLEECKETKKLFGLSRPIGKEISIGGLRFKVVGIVRQKSGDIGEIPSPKIYIPLSTLQKINPAREIDILYAKVKDYNWVKKGKEQIEAVLIQRYGKNHGFLVECAADMIEITKNVMNIVTLIGTGIASISLIVGGIGIANMMLVTVAERRREIGIRKAIGAKKRDILTQFLIEAVTLCLLGGITGIFLGVVVGNIFNLVLDLPLSFQFWVILVGFIFASGVGVFSGIFPAIRAANLDPIEALRYE